MFFGHHKNHDRWFRRPKYNIPMNVVDKDEHYEVWLYAVSFEKANIKISVVDDILYISGTREPEEKQPNFIRQEYPIKSFERVLKLNKKVAIEQITAQQKEGVLIVHLPKTQEAKSQAKEVNIT
ncbi:MAG: Hsp20/alpha crystallin family protein [Cytophagales bacterium]|nr:MAG: Hsp20/alpha crystallin family protein [Cytophagales bacterium]